MSVLDQGRLVGRMLGLFLWVVHNPSGSGLLTWIYPENLGLAMVVAINVFELQKISNSFTDAFPTIAILLRLELFLHLLCQTLKLFDLAQAVQLTLVP